MMVYAVGDTASVPQLMVENLAEIAQLPDEDGRQRRRAARPPGAPPTPMRRARTVPGLGEFSTAKLLVLEDGKYNEVRDLGEVSMGQPDVLASFVDEAADRFPAKHYGFTFFDHGGGNTGGYVDTGPPGTQELIRPGDAGGADHGHADGGHRPLRRDRPGRLPHGQLRDRLRAGAARRSGWPPPKRS